MAYRTPQLKQEIDNSLWLSRPEVNAIRRRKRQRFVRLARLPDRLAPIAQALAPIFLQIGVGDSLEFSSDDSLPFDMMDGGFDAAT